MSDAFAFPALLFDGRSLRAHAVMLEVQAGNARLQGDDWARDFPLAELRVSPRVGHAQRFIALPGGAELVCPDDPALDLPPAASKSEGIVAWLERRAWVALLSVLATMAGVAAFYVYGLPRVAESAARHISPERERALGEHALTLFDKRMTRPTDLDQETISELRTGFAELNALLPPEQRARLELRNSHAIGPNAFALPGGIVVVTDQMLWTCSSDETIAVLAHELGHVEHRHALRHLLQEAGVSALGTMLTSDASGLSLSATTLPLLLAQAHYSQAFEQDADADGFRLLRLAGWSPELFASCLQKIAKKVGSDGSRNLMSYASTHPPDSERIERAMQAAAGFKPWRKLAAAEKSDSDSDSEPDSDSESDAGEQP